jgi:ribulose 1,5-bisphosphate synthetase/thiazole synthase
MADPVVIVGAGAAGLATARELAARRIPYRILERGGGLVACDARGFAVRADRVRGARHDALFFVGHNYDASGGLLNIARDAPLAAAAIAEVVRRRAWPSSPATAAESPRRGASGHRT